MNDEAKGTRGDVLALTFRGLDLCDGCGIRLEPGERLAGLCPVCLEPKSKAYTLPPDPSRPEIGQPERHVASHDVGC